MNLHEFWQILHAEQPSHPVFYRAYHNEQGTVLFYSMEDLPGTYIEISAETFASSPLHVVVRDGKLVQKTWKTTSKLVPGDTGTPCHPDDVAIVVNNTQPHICWSKRTYETN